MPQRPIRRTVAPCHDESVTLPEPATLPTLRTLPTPAVVIEQPRVLANIDRMQERADRRGIRMRPHTKTHKSPVVARWQIDRGAIGICCAKLGEAEVFASAGFTDIRLPFPIHPSNAARVLSLMER